MGGSRDANVKQAGESKSIDETKQLGWGEMSVHPRQQSEGRQGYCTSEISCFFRMNTSNNQRKVHSRGTETEERKPSGYTEQGIPKLGLCWCLGQLFASEDGLGFRFQFAHSDLDPSKHQDPRGYTTKKL